jgi:hypothetical protein
MLKLAPPTWPKPASGSGCESSSLPSKNSRYPVVGDREAKTAQVSPAVVLPILNEPVAPMPRPVGIKVGKLSRMNEVPEISFAPVGSSVKPSPFSSPPSFLPKRLTELAKPPVKPSAVIVTGPPGRAWGRSGWFPVPQMVNSNHTYTYTQRQRSLWQQGRLSGQSSDPTRTQADMLWNECSLFSPPRLSSS